MRLQGAPTVLTELSIFFFFSVPSCKRHQLGHDHFVPRLSYYKACPNKTARFNFVIQRTIGPKVLTFLFRFKVHTLRLIVEHNIRQMSLHDSAGTQNEIGAHFKSCVLFGAPCILFTNHVAVGGTQYPTNVPPRLCWHTERNWRAL